MLKNEMKVAVRIEVNNYLTSTGCKAVSWFEIFKMLNNEAVKLLVCQQLVIAQEKTWEERDKKEKAQKEKIVKDVISPEPIVISGEKTVVPFEFAPQVDILDPVAMEAEDKRQEAERQALKSIKKASKKPVIVSTKKDIIATITESELDASGKLVEVSKKIEVFKAVPAEKVKSIAHLGTELTPKSRIKA